MLFTSLLYSSLILTIKILLKKKKKMRLGTLGHLIIPSERSYSNLKDNNSVKSLNPSWVSDFTDGEGSFWIYFTKYDKCKVGYLIQPNFQITIHKKNIIRFFQKSGIKKNFFDVGGVYKDGKSLFKCYVRLLN